ncbi:coiled-coil domain-containing protein 107 isoform X1 [Alligator mississippiensis]|uniref:coiled-coil domain-containing protein 107 isoform X1 n=1 Tax=Alligator mississippiensis TaxID=8496 RepID=UPI0006EC8390|nr:coiled-coil domain-containing protein 107 isoform X1 [Alligator mississippiensis]
MALSVQQQALVSVALVLCAFVAMPRMLGGRAGRAGPSQPRPGGPEGGHQSHMNPGSSESKTHQSFQQMRNAMGKEMKSERTRGNGRDIAFTLMPLYAIGVGMFAAYKFVKLRSSNNEFHQGKHTMKSQEESSSQKDETIEDKAKETEHQLLELEQHLAQTEKMLNSLLTQLDPLSNCVNALACEQKDEIVTQLRSIRQLMKESGLDKSEIKLKGDNHTCNEKLEDLINSFGEHLQEEEVDDNEDYNNEDLLEDTDDNYRMEEPELCGNKLTVSQLIKSDVVEVRDINKDVLEPEETILRRRNRYE